MFTFITKFFKKKESNNSVDLSNKITNAVAAFQDTIEQLTQVSSQANAAIVEHEKTIAELNKENDNLRQTITKADAIKEKLTNIFI